MTASPAEPLSFESEWFDRTSRSFDDAVQKTGQPRECSYLIAGGKVTFRFAGAAVYDRFVRAFEHLDSPSDDRPSLVVNLWDSASTGAPEPPVPDLRFDEEAPGAVASYGTSRIRAIFQPNLQALSMFDVADSSAWYWTTDARRLPEWECGTPIRYILNWWLGERGSQVLHSGAVATRFGGVLLAGRAGSGKSTSSLSTLAAGFRYAGDDYVAVTLDPPWVHSLYNSAKLDPEDGHRFVSFLPSLVDAAKERDVGSDKAVVYVHRDQPEQTVSGFPLRALLIPRITDSPDSRVVELSRAKALAALAPSTIVQLHTAAPEALANMTKVVERIPCYRLHVGTDLQRIPVAISDLLDRIGSS